MDTIIFEILSVDTLKQIRNELGGYIRDQIYDVERKAIPYVDDKVFEAYLKVQQVLMEKEGI